MRAWVLTRRRDGHAVYWTGQVAWGRGDLHQPVMTDRLDEARKYEVREDAEAVFKVWPALEVLTMTRLEG